MKKILVLHTGGTISMQADEAGHVRPENDNPMNHVGVNLDNHMRPVEVGIVSINDTKFSRPGLLDKFLDFASRKSQIHGGTSFDGTVRFNPQVRAGWFDQHHERTLRPDRTVLENVMEDSPHQQTLARTVLTSLGFERDAVFKPVSVLSGGEKAKAALARLLLTDLNLLILDEPTNHLDLFTMQALESLLAGYGGTLLFVSHDRAFVSAVATRVATLENGSLSTFEGTLSQLEAERDRDRDAERRQLAITALEMRLAALAGRMAAPRKGDNPEALSAEYDALAAQLREMKRGG